MIAISGIIPRLRGIIDPVVYQKDTLAQDGTQYVEVLTAHPVQYGSDQIYLTDTTFTTGIPRRIYQIGTQPSGYNDTTNNYVYSMDYTRGEFSVYFGSGNTPGSGLTPFAPWAESSVIAYYYTSKYEDGLLAQYIADAVAPVEIALQLGMYVSGVNGLPSSPRDIADVVDYETLAPCKPQGALIVCEDLEILQSLFADGAALTLMTRERRLGAGNAIRIVDGDITIDTSVNQRYLKDFVNDFAKEYNTKLRWVAHNILDGYNIRQLDEMAKNSIRRNAWATQDGRSINPNIYP